MKRPAILLFLVVIFKFPAFCFSKDSVPGNDFSRYSKISVLDSHFKSGILFSKVTHFKRSVFPATIRPRYAPDIRQLRSNVSQDLYLLKIEARNNELRNMFTGVLSTFIKQ